LTKPRFTALVESLPATIPFVAPDALERSSGRPIRLRLGANESAFGVSPLARRAMLEAIERIAWYADPENFYLRRKLAEVYRVQMENLVVGSGIDDLLGLVVRTFVDPGSPVVTSLGSYPTFNYHVAGYGGVLHRVPYRNDHNDLEALAEAARKLNARLVYLANPDNPTGTWHGARRLCELLERLPDDCLVVLDEAYVEFAPPEDLLAIDAKDSRLIRLRTFSKAHGMAGVRIGYGIAAAETISAFDKVRLHFGVNMFAQVGARASLDDPQFIAGVVGAVDEGREDYYRLAGELGLPFIHSATNFVCFDMGSQAAAHSLVNTLFDRGVFIRMPGAPPLDRLIRVTVASALERAEFGRVMHELANKGLLRRNAIPVAA
jgi:histidinol-phosphate aminotransferase